MELAIQDRVDMLEEELPRRPAKRYPPRVVVHGEQQAADLASGSGAHGEAADHELLPPLALHLKPGVGADSAVRRVESFGHDAFQAPAAR